MKLGRICGICNGLCMGFVCENFVYGLLCLCELFIWTLYVTFIYTSTETFFFLRMKISMQATLHLFCNKTPLSCFYLLLDFDNSEHNCQPRVLSEVLQRKPLYQVTFDHNFPEILK